jgi:hypothetical protein
LITSFIKLTIIVKYEFKQFLAQIYEHSFNYDSYI